jgi:hypothetical protein
MLPTHPLESVKTLYERFTESEHERLKEVKGDDRTWREAILEEFGITEENNE